MCHRVPGGSPRPTLSPPGLESGSQQGTMGRSVSAETSAQLCLPPRRREAQTRPVATPTQPRPRDPIGQRARAATPRPPPAPSLARVPAAPRAAEPGSPSALRHHLLPGVGNERSPGPQARPLAPSTCRAPGDRSRQPRPGSPTGPSPRYRRAAPAVVHPAPDRPQGVTPTPLTWLTVPRRPASAAVSRRGVSVPRAAARPDGGQADAARQPH